MYQDAENIFKQIPDYKDAAEMAKECRYRFAADRLKSGLFEDVENIFLIIRILKSWLKSVVKKPKYSLKIKN